MLLLVAVLLVVLLVADFASDVAEPDVVESVLSAAEVAFFTLGVPVLAVDDGALEADFAASTRLRLSSTDLRTLDSGNDLS
ncbi:hypothetical protein GCM10011575_30950 [Microlunatus endophyticus]|uniref:Uncharacterized protein n=1 Tax=Microlunatus endophyticus TaxID=1716077 RepID=A0A917W567_9ACTN|nr:hypothetical protein GCM10011575_30950 [Microlunatus endophyticus]